MPLDQRIVQRLKLRELRIFIAVARCGSMGKAAGQLAVSQPAISKAIAELEHTLGVQLLDRSMQGVEPTIYGKALLKWAPAVFDDLRQAARELQHLADPTAGEVRIGSTEPMSAGLVPAVINRLSRRYGRVSFSVIQAPTIMSQYQDLRGRSVDLILGRMMPSETAPDLNAEILFNDPLFVVAGTKHKWARRRVIDPHELIDQAWSLPPYETSYAGEVIAQAFRGVGLKPPDQTVSSNSIQLFNALLATGRFLSVLSGSTLRLGGTRMGLKALPVNFPIRSGPVGIVTLKGRLLSPIVQLFAECAREVARPLAGLK